ncbi:tetratricopeptide repeat protein [Deinococcus hopiensis]|uniref:tetratricopeptide repeat protein n=1 Tax=Deinococcus hopiensis TaxID=309885 RepID=UPI00111C71EC|nr:tetratricopeptide repeat protein [Deinococcus hopiensis]
MLLLFRAFVLILVAVSVVGWTTLTAINGYSVSKVRERAASLAGLAQYDQSWKALETELKRNPKSAELWSDLGQTYRAAWYLHDAGLTTAPAKLLREPDLWFNHSKDWLFNHALSAYKEAARLNRLSAMPWYEMGRLLSLAEHHSEADAAFEQALKRDPHNPGFIVDRAKALERAGHTEAALAAFRKAEEILPNQESESAEERLK